MLVKALAVIKIWGLFGVEFYRFINHEEVDELIGESDWPRFNYWNRSLESQ